MSITRDNMSIKDPGVKKKANDLQCDRLPIFDCVVPQRDFTIDSMVVPKLMSIMTQPDEGSLFNRSAIIFHALLAFASDQVIATFANESIHLTGWAFRSTWSRLQHSETDEGRVISHATRHAACIIALINSRNTSCEKMENHAIESLHALCEFVANESDADKIVKDQHAIINRIHYAIRIGMLYAWDNSKLLEAYIAHGYIAHTCTITTRASGVSPIQASALSTLDLSNYDDVVDRQADLRAFESRETDIFIRVPIRKSDEYTSRMLAFDLQQRVFHTCTKLPDNRFRFTTLRTLPWTMYVCLDTEPGMDGACTVSIDATSTILGPTDFDCRYGQYEMSTLCKVRKWKEMGVNEPISFIISHNEPDKFNDETEKKKTPELLWDEFEVDLRDIDEGIEYNDEQIEELRVYNKKLASNSNTNTIEGKLAWLKAKRDNDPTIVHIVEREKDDELVGKVILDKLNANGFNADEPVWIGTHETGVRAMRDALLNVIGLGRGEMENTADLSVKSDIMIFTTLRRRPAPSEFNFGDNDDDDDDDEGSHYGDDDKGVGDKDPDSESNDEDGNDNDEEEQDEEKKESGDTKAANKKKKLSAIEETLANDEPGQQIDVTLHMSSVIPRLRKQFRRGGSTFLTKSNELEVDATDEHKTTRVMKLITALHTLYMVTFAEPGKMNTTRKNIVNDTISLNNRLISAWKDETKHGKFHSKMKESLQTNKFASRDALKIHKLSEAAIKLRAYFIEIARESINEATAEMEFLDNIDYSLANFEPMHDTDEDVNNLSGLWRVYKCDSELTNAARILFNDRALWNHEVVDSNDNDNLLFNKRCIKSRDEEFILKAYKEFDKIGQYAREVKKKEWVKAEDADEDYPMADGEVPPTEKKQREQFEETQTTEVIELQTRRDAILSTIRIRLRSCVDKFNEGFWLHYNKTYSHQDNAEQYAADILGPQVAPSSPLPKKPKRRIVPESGAAARSPQKTPVKEWFLKPRRTASGSSADNE